MGILAGVRKLISTVDEYRALASIEDRQRRREAWVDEYEAAHPDVFTTYYSAWGDRDRREAAADGAPRLVETIVAREARMRSVLAVLEDRMARAGVGVEGLQTVLLVGVSTSNGWAAISSGVPSLFLALELLTDGPGDEVLAVHEAIHAVHQGRVRDVEAVPETVAFALYCEGLAVAASRLAVPGLADSQYLWFDAAHADWVHECESHSHGIRSFVADHLDSPEDDPAVAGVFLNRPIDGLPTRCGYWLGDQMISDWLAAGMGVDELLALPPRTAILRVREWCDSNGP